MIRHVFICSVLLFGTSVHAQEVSIFGKGLEAFKAPQGDWMEVGKVGLDPQNPKKLTAEPGKGIWYNGPKGNARNLLTTAHYGDVEVHLEFLVPQNSNSGLKFHGHYEIQIKDSFGRKELSGDDCGGIYPRAELKPKYHHIDKGTAPRVNASKAPGEWQSLHAIFLAPRFDPQGKKTANAKLVKVLLNDQLIHENLELQTPTGNLWRGPEMKEGPLFLQGDHGPVAFRNFWVKKLD